jgi:hypothetical protein
MDHCHFQTSEVTRKISNEHEMQEATGEGEEMLKFTTLFYQYRNLEPKVQVKKQTTYDRR